MADSFKVRRDGSTNNVPVVGYNEGIDAQDVVLFGACKVSETLTTDGTGVVTLTDYPVSVLGVVTVDVNGVRRGRNLNDDITIMYGSTKCYAGAVSPTDKTVKVYSDSARTSVMTGVDVTVSYYKRVPIKVNADGELSIVGDVNVTNTSLKVIAASNIPVEIKSSDIPLSGRTKQGIMFKKEGTIAAGASATEIPLTIGDTTKDMYITNIVAYYTGTGESTDTQVGFYFDILDASNNSTTWMDMMLPPKVQGMLQLDLGSVGITIPANGKFRFRTASSWTQNAIHVCAYGYQYVD